MNSFSEASFGAKLLKAKNLHQTILGFSGYAPPNPQDMPAALGNLLDDITDANDSEIDQENLYIQAVQARQGAFWENNDSISKLLSPLRAAVEAQYTKKSKEYESVIRHIRGLRSQRSIKEPLVATGGNGGAAGEGELPSEKVVSQSEQSYGSVHRRFADLVLTLEKMPGFAPSNNKLKPTNLKTFSTSLEAMHTNVINKYNALRTQRNDRQALYDDLATRVKRIKAYVLAQYGSNSSEYAAVKGA